MVYTFGMDPKLRELRRKEGEGQKESMMTTKEDKTPKLTDVVFGWSIEDVMNKDLYKNKVDPIPENFSSVHHYLSSFTTPLIEETHADLRSNMIMGVQSAAALEIYDVRMIVGFKAPNNLLYLIRLEKLPEESVNKYKPEVGDLIALTEVRPKCIDDLNGPRRSYVVALVRGVGDEGTISIQSSCLLFEEDKEGKAEDELFAVYLTNLTTNMRIWKALHPCEDGFSAIIKSILRINPSEMQREDNCGVCSNESGSTNLVKTREVINSFGLDGSQKDAVMNCVALTHCDHRNTAKLIWGPPGTGKTKTIASLAFSLLNIKCRTLTCAPTNVAVVGVAKRLMSCLVRKLEHDTYGLGDVVLLGNGKRMKIDEHDDLYDVFLDHRVGILAECFAPLYGWRGSLDKMIHLLQDPKEQYQRYLQQWKVNEEDVDTESEDDDEDEDEEEEVEENCKEISRMRFFKELVIQNKKENKNKNRKSKEKVKFRKCDGNEIGSEANKETNDVPWTFEEFFSKEFVAIGEHLNFCTIGLYTNMPTVHLPLEVVTNMIEFLDFLKVVHKHVISERGFKDLFRTTDLHDTRLQTCSPSCKN